tara:strand:+ start:1942 stop:2847 length:906 start_codon:yes stop_codon:yes gene_type:complete
MKKLIADYKLSEAETKNLVWTFSKDSDYDTIIDYDCEAYTKTGQPLFVFIKNYIEPQILEDAYHALKNAAQPTNNRGASSGGERKNRILKDGTISKTTQVYIPGTNEQVKDLSGIIGYFDRGAHFDFCRRTAYNIQNPENFKQGMKLMETVDAGFKKYVPYRYKKQKEMIMATDPNYRIGDTAFTTVTVNKDYRTAYHTDQGDYAKGFGNLVAYMKDMEPVLFVLPRYGIAINLSTNDLLLVDVHQVHGNTEIIKKSEDAIRLSFVMYYRENMWKCLSPDQELKRIQKNQRVVAQKFIGKV